MDAYFRKARKEIGLPDFERNARLTYENNRLKKAYNVPGTLEHGKHVQLMRDVVRLAAKLRDQDNDSVS